MPEAGCPAGALDAAGAELADTVSRAADGAVGDGASDVALADVGPEADELALCVQPTRRAPATARAPPASSVRQAAILVIFLDPLSARRVPGPANRP